MASPAPRPNIILPLDMWSRVEAVWASTAGCLLCTSLTHVPSFIFGIWVARAASIVHASRALMFLNPIPTVWSAMNMPSKPSFDASMQFLGLGSMDVWALICKLNHEFIFGLYDFISMLTS